MSTPALPPLPTAGARPPRLQADAAPPSPVRMAFVGAGGMARHHLSMLLAQPLPAPRRARHWAQHATALGSTEIAALCDPDPKAYVATAALFEAAGITPPAYVPDFGALLAGAAGPLDALFIITPHNLHHAQAVAALQAGLDVLLEKPMVMTAGEARDLIAVQQQTGRLLVVAFNGSLSPSVRAAARMLRSGLLGEILAINAVVWQNWRERTAGTWRQEPAISGGGFLFDTGAHMLNTVVDLAGEPVLEVMARLDRRGAPVDITGAVLARLCSGALVTLNASGATAPIGATLGSEVQIFCTQGIVRTGVWGERLLVQRPGQHAPRPVRVPSSSGPWEQFLRVRAGLLENPCPPLVGLRMALLWDAIQASALHGGAPVAVADC